MLCFLAVRELILFVCFIFSPNNFFITVVVILIVTGEFWKMDMIRTCV